jgi:site-specific DNA-cytosine methylase
VVSGNVTCICSLKDFPCLIRIVFGCCRGMRLSLPKSIRGREVKSITAYDCSNTVNDIYDYNFHRPTSSVLSEESPSLPHRYRDMDPDSVEASATEPTWRGYYLRSELKRILIDGLKVHDVDGKADIWTMSPPCQPYTTTRGSKQLDEKDNRSRPLFHLMNLLLEMR